MNIPGIAALLIVLCLTPAFAHAGLFGYAETLSDDLTPFSKWTGMLERDRAHGITPNTPCTDPFIPCYADTWRSLMDEVRTLPLPEQLTRINQHYNNTDYILDPINWGVPDYWAAPLEFAARNGDCEDYAIAKYLTLRTLGIAPESMRIVVLQDLNLGVVHSVLAVYHNQSIYVLDNQIEQVVKDKDIHHYTPIYSINEHGWWRHLPRA